MANQLDAYEPEDDEDFDAGDSIEAEQEVEDISMADFMELPWGDQFE